MAVSIRTGPTFIRGSAIGASKRGHDSIVTDIAEKPSMIDRIIIRPFHQHDAIPPITRLLHAAYAPLAAMNLRYTATHQSDDVTESRLRRGLPWVAEMNGEIVATVTLYPDAGNNSGCAWYDTSGVFSFGQFAVRPDLQGKGLGRELITLMANEAVARGATELALDTAEGALHLIRWYEKLGFRFVEFMDWSSTNYRSVVLSKTLQYARSEQYRQSLNLKESD